MSEPLIETEGLGHRFFRQTVLDGIDLTVPAGSVCGLVGPNGAGKSTLLRILVRLLRPTRGRARVLGTDVARLGPRQLDRIGYVAAEQELPEWMTGDRLLRYLRPLYSTWDERFCRQLVRRFAVPLDRPIASLSRGERMRIALVAGIAFRPRLLILDEPFAGLDAMAQDDMVAGALEAANGEGWGVVVASHDLDLVERLADRVMVLRAGRGVLDGAVDDLLTRYRRLRFRRLESGLGEDAPDADSASDDGPDSWLHVERHGDFLDVIDRRFDAEAVSRWADRHAVALETAHPMSLREIFTAVSRAASRRTP